MLRNRWNDRLVFGATLGPILALAALAGISVEAAQTSWQQDWERTEAAAKKEGRLVLSAAPSELWRAALTTFEKDYPDIKMEYTGINSRDIWPRIGQERKLGQYLWDLRIGGPENQVYLAKKDGTLDPVRSLLVLPEVVESSKWLGGFDGIFADKERQYVPTFLTFVRSTVYVNRDLIPESELGSDSQLIQPKWKGKIVLQDPRGGAGLTNLAVMLVVHGEEYIRTLLTKQDIVVTGDNRQQAEWAVRGRYPIAIGLNFDQIARFQEEGLKVNIQPVRKGAVSLLYGFGSIQLLNRAPHPNAAKLFINWLLTRKVQTELSKTVRANSRRLDVPPVIKDEAADPNQLSRYIHAQIEDLTEVRDRTLKLAGELIK